ncbi:Helicase [Neofusicoccum parvum]|uniref:Helicase n=1 Tax=Neofusicoccum parvum TaxID=310453 RepID=A0ACB5SP64_9PEZI|nr:Helicase [Neofusicoccum parvum]
MGSDALQPPNWSDFYGSLFSRRVDLVGDYAGSEPFLVDGDSLLLHCFSDDKLDFQDGFQMLHAVWLVERFLDGLRRRNCVFHLAFFDDHAPHCVPSHATDDQRAKYLLARAVVLRHLEVNLARASAETGVLCFPSISSPAWDAARAANGYLFIMMNDGAADACDCAAHVRDKTALRLAICSHITRGYSVALVNGLEWKDTKVYTAVIEGIAKSDITTPPAAEVSESSAADGDQKVPSFEREQYEAFSKYHGSAEEKLSERLYLVAAAAGIILSMDIVPSSHVAAFLAHAVFQGQIRLGSRSCATAGNTEESRPLLHNFAKVAQSILQSPHWQSFVNEAQPPSDIADLVDGRLFSTIIGSKDSGLKLDAESTRTLKSMTSLVALVAGNPPVVEDQQLPLELSQSNGKPSRSYPKLLPFNDTLFDKHLDPIKLDIDDDAVQHPTTSNSQLFSELKHWRDAKRPLNRKAALSSKQRSAFYARRRDQRFMAEMMAYAASLTNAVGKALEPETIIMQSATPAPAQPTKGQQQSGKVSKSGGGKNKQPSKKQAILDNLAAEKDKKDSATASKVASSWDAVCKDIDRVRQPSVCHAKALQYLNALPNAKREVVGAEVELYLLNCLIELWKSSVAANSKSPNFGLAARIWDSVHRLRNMSGITKTTASKLQQTVDTLGLPFSISSSGVPDRKLPFEFALRPGMNNLKIPLPSKEFQLLHCGPYFDRKMDSAPDDRVPFLPDGWQRKVLDVIDAEKSLFVVAPTSAGKTFISFYAMKKVLEGSNEGVLVYVAPTKALVNQIAAEIQARFSKSYKHAGKSIWGIHTRDYRVNSATGCQVLVTVPHVLQTMLLAPANADSWSSRIKRIIFDEVHCIGQAEDGIVWEQLLLLAPCPIVALSATVGNPQEFYSWLSSAQKATGTDLVMVHHPHRFSDLRKFVYAPPNEFTFTGLPKAPPMPRAGLDKGEGFEFVHPVASLLNRSRGIPEDLALEARDCYYLWQAMKAHETDVHKVDDSLSPNVRLPAIIAQADTIAWSNDLKQVLSKWMADPSSPFDAVVQDLGQGLFKLEAENDTGLDGDDLVNTVLPLLCQLQEQSALPAILFNYDRTACENICEALMNKLKSAEQEWKDTSPTWEKKIAAWETWKKNRKTKKAPPKKSGKLEDGMSKADMERDAGAMDSDSWESFDPNAAQDGFHFMDRTKLPPSELDAYSRELTYRGVPAWLIEALYRGIGVHHAGMNRKYRHVVELLFRKGYLRVIVATGTLALGVNMPCKTVVFCGDSVYLTALNFRQAAGRAGRRGFDVLGNVVFHGIAVSKSRLYLGGPESRMTVLHHLRFSLEYLRRQFLLDQSGAPLNFAGAVSNLYYTESSNFAFHALLKDGYFHRLSAGIRENPESTERIIRTLMIVLSHLFGRQYCRQVDRELVEEIQKNSPSGVFLPPLPEDAETVLRQHNRETLGIFSTYVKTFVEQHVEDDDCSLPLSGLRFGGDSGDAPVPTIRSNFVALSGHGDKFETISELCGTVRGGVFLEEAVIPYVPLDTELPLNGYLFDFFKHGDVTALANANNIHKGEVWFVLNDFSMILATIITTLSNMLHPDADGEADILDAVGGGDAHEEQVEDKLLEAAAPPEPKTALPVQVKKTRKKDVADSWDDGIDDDDNDSVNGATNGHADDGVKWEDGEGGNLLDVLVAFKKLSEEFNEKFKAMWA